MESLILFTITPVLPGPKDFPKILEGGTLMKGIVYLKVTLLDGAIFHSFTEILESIKPFTKTPVLPGPKDFSKILKGGTAMKDTPTCENVYMLFSHLFL